MSTDELDRQMLASEARAELTERYVVQRGGGGAVAAMSVAEADQAGSGAQAAGSGEKKMSVFMRRRLGLDDPA
jgi:hypothetical protein